MVVNDQYRAGEEVQKNNLFLLIINQIFNNYTPRSNGDLLRLYGFIEKEENPNNKWILPSLEISSGDENYSLKLELLQKNDLIG
jgi:hypothetical protein